MDNNARSERTRAAVIQAALTIIARDGAGHLTLDAIAKESGISKGGLLHQFPNKRAVLAALLDHQAGFFAAFSQHFIEAHGAEYAQPRLAAQIATLREVLNEPNSLAFAVLAAASQDPSFLSTIREGDAETIAEIRAEAAVPDRAVQHWYAARGLAFSVLLGLCPLAAAERQRLFQDLLDGLRQPAQEKPAPAKPRRTRKVSA